MRTLFSTLTLLLIAVASVYAVSPTEPGVAITIYNENFAVVKERRNMDFQKGVNTVKFTDVAASIDPTSVNFKCLSSPGSVLVLEQNYEYDLVNTSSLLKRYIDKQVNIIVKGSGSNQGSLKSGVLKAAIGSDLIISNKQGGMDIISRNAVEHISLAKSPEDLVTKPTLVWLTDADESGPELCQVTYTTSNINWKADYSAVLNDTEDALDLTAWVTVDNQSGTAYKDATLKLIAGDVRRIQPRPVVREKVMIAESYAVDSAAGFEEKKFMDYHMYTLGRQSTINNNQVKQIELMPVAHEVFTEKLYVYEVGRRSYMRKSDKVQIKFEFDNTEGNQLGIALPKGKVRVFKKDPADDTLEFVGEDQIDHTAKKETISLYIGNAFDVIAEDKIVDSKRNSRYERITHQVEIRNRKDVPVVVFVDDLSNQNINSDISNNSLSYERKDAYTTRFKVPVKADSTEKLIYTVTYTW